MPQQDNSKEWGWRPSKRSFVQRETMGMKKARRYSLLVLVQIFAGHVILRHFVGMNFFLISVVGGLHSRNYVGLERVPFFEQFVDTFGIRGFDVGQTL